ncbi:MAG TPA: Mur ligase domain-containing protein, partial [bacterium]|nr:Mur ligase domain-containing protein [bacterium]
MKRIYRGRCNGMHVHFVGIGGSGVSGLALMAVKMGYEVSGCDEKISPYFKMVESRGIRCHVGHSSDHIKGVDLVVRSSAVPMDAEEIQAALKKGI